MLQTGIRGYHELIVDEHVTASSYGSGLLDVFATPAMIAMVECTAWSSVQPYLEEGCSTVGTQVNMEHLAATPVGMKVWCNTQLVTIDRRALTFEAEVYDAGGLIARGTHQRFIIDNERFLKKAEAKRQG